MGSGVTPGEIVGSPLPAAEAGSFTSSTFFSSSYSLASAAWVATFASSAAAVVSAAVAFASTILHLVVG